MTLSKTYRSIMGTGLRLPYYLYSLIAEVDTKAVAKSKVTTFKSEEQTGDGTEQSIAHTLGATPTLVFVVPTLVGTDGVTITEGTHGSANLKVTATTGAKYKVVAILIA